MRTLKKIKAPYSLKNKKTNATLANSTLNPLTNSLSPSEKSKGARLSSASIIKKKGIKRKTKSNLKKEKKDKLEK